METKITKKITGLLVLLFAVTSFMSFAQEDGKKKMCDIIMKQAPYIFEGKIISRSAFKTSTGSSYNSIIIEVDEVVKGSLKKGTVEMLECTGMIDKDGLEETFQVFDGPTMPDGKGIFFCYDDNSAPNSTAIKTNSKAIKIWDAVPLINNEIKKDPRGGISDYFTNATEFYQYLNNNYSLNIDKALLEKKSPNTTTQPVNKKITPEQNAEQIRKLKESIKVKSQRIKQANKTASSSCSDLFLSEQLDGNSSDNMVEIYNPTASPISLSNYKLLIYHNASLTPTTIALTGTISAYGTHVVVQNGASSAITATSAQLYYPSDVDIDASGNLYISEIGNNTIRKVDVAGIISTVAGNSIGGFSGDGGLATLAQINQPTGVALDSYGNIFITDQGNQRIRKVTVSTLMVKEETFQNTSLQVFPNPTSDQFFIDANTSDKITVDLYDVNGRHVFGASVNDKSNINVTTLDKGIYTLTIKSVDRVTNKKLVIAR